MADEDENNNDKLIFHKDLSTRLNISSQHIFKYETYESPNYCQAETIAQAFDLYAYT